MRKISGYFAVFLCILSVFSCKPDDDKNEAEWSTVSQDKFQGCKVNNIVIDTYGNKWFATSSGLAAYNDEKWVCYQNSIMSDKNKINWIEIADIQEETSLLLATDLGITVLSFDENMLVETKVSYLGDSADLLSDTIARIVKGKYDDIWVLSKNGLSFSNGGWHRETGFANLDNIPAKSALMPGSGPYYSGRKRNGMVKFIYSDIDGITGASEWIPPYNGVILDTVNYIFKSANGDLWIASFGNELYTGNFMPKDGLIKHSGDNPKEGFTYFNSLYGGLANNRIHCIDESGDNKIWLATEGGISYQVNDTLFANYTTADGLVSNKVYCISFDTDGSLWCGTDHGISHFRNGVFTSFFNE